MIINITKDDGEVLEIAYMHSDDEIGDAREIITTLEYQFELFDNQEEYDNKHKGASCENVYD